MATFKKAEADTYGIVSDILNQYDTHRQLVDAGVKVDVVFALADVGEDGEKKGVALKLHGIRALGITKIISLKNRVMGRGDAEISLDGDWWETASEEQRKALLDHELNHIEVKANDDGGVDTDDHLRPKLKLRKHDYEFGWFNIVAERHGKASIERQQAALIMDGAGQFYWPSVTKPAPRLEYVVKSNKSVPVEA